MSIFICPNCEEKSQMVKRESGKWKTDTQCPHCGHVFEVDQDLNIVVDESVT